MLFSGVTKQMKIVVRQRSICFLAEQVAHVPIANKTLIVKIHGTVAKLTIPLNDQLHACRHAMKKLRGNQGRYVGLSLPVLRYRTRKSATVEEICKAAESDSEIDLNHDSDFISLEESQEVPLE